MRIVFIGPPGAGKGTQSERLAERLGVTRLSTGDVLREAKQLDTPAGREIKARLDAGDLVSDDLVLRIVADRLAEADCRHGYLFDGFPRTLPQAIELDGLLADNGAKLDAALELIVPDEELFQRLSGRGREDDNDETIRQRLRAYADLTSPLSGYYEKQGLLRPIDGVGEPEEVYQRLAAAIEIE